MKPSRINRQVASMVRSQAKMFEYRVPVEYYDTVSNVVVPERLFTPAIATLGDIAAGISRRRLSDVQALDNDERYDLLFHARVLWMHAESMRCVDLNRSLHLLSSAAYYLAAMPGISKVMFDRYAFEGGSEVGEVELGLAWLLAKPWVAGFPRGVGISSICESIHLSISGKKSDDVVIEEMSFFRKNLYSNSNSEDLLLGDLFCAVARERLANSARKLLPALSRIQSSEWHSYFVKERSLPELWPSQKLLGGAGVYAGASAIVQMPTSAGKTKAIELVVRSAFLSRRAKLAVVVAPFRALCSEIAAALREEFSDDAYQVNQVSDVIQVDYLEGIFEFLDFSEAMPEQTPAVLVLTPEKLLYILRHKPELAQQIGLIVYDEGHQFDTGTRGVTYELLVTSIKGLVQKSTQVVLISAVIQNPEALSEWLLNSKDSVVRDTNIQTQRTIAYASWRGESGGISYADPDADSESFMVPKVLEGLPLILKGKERRQRLFPERGDSTSIAIFLAATLVPNGAVALFCGLKASVSRALRDALDVFSRQPNVEPPSVHCRQEELSKLVSLYRRNFGEESYLTQAAALGMFGHHSDTPHGLRVAIEFAMRNGDIRFIACTSTLAQGVNLPIRYLLITGTRQGTGRIKTRDFHNLMGRAGRAGIHGEGTVIFTDEKVFDGRRDGAEVWRWNEVQSLLHPDNTEPTESTLLSVLSPIYNSDRTRTLGPSPLGFLNQIVQERTGVLEYVRSQSQVLAKAGFDPQSVVSEVEFRMELVAALESFLMSSSTQDEDIGTIANRLAAETLAYSLANDSEKAALLSLFDTMAAHIETHVPDVDVRRRYGRTLLGVDASISINIWADSHAETILSVDSPRAMLRAVWPLLESSVSSSRLSSSLPAGAILEIAERWIEGDTFEEIFRLSQALGVKYPYGRKFREYKIDEIVGLCEQSFGFEVQLVVAALLESIQTRSEGSGDGAVHLERLQKMLKYGLNSQNAIAFFEAGFSERVVATHLASRVKGEIPTLDSMKELLRDNFAFFERELEVFPAFFLYVLKSLSTG